MFHVRTREHASREIAPWILLRVLARIGTLRNDDDDGSENITKKLIYVLLNFMASIWNY